MDYVLFGIQGSGKGTQGKILSQRLSAAYFETGGELRRLAHENSPLGEKVKSIIEAGNLVPNEVVMEIVANFVGMETLPKTAIIFDGIPRNKEQSETFESLLKKLGRDYTGIYFKLSREEAENRLLHRRICKLCKTVYPASFTGESCGACGGMLMTRTDDNPESIRTRLDIFFKETMPVIEAWANQGKMIEVDGAKSIDEVTQELVKKLAA